MFDFLAWIADCRFRSIESFGEVKCQVAVWANSPEGFRAALDVRLAQVGYKLSWIEEVLPATQYLARHGEQQKVGGIATRSEARDARGEVLISSFDLNM